ncbi:McrC family protein [Winogradskyella sp. MH6]|uniref:McrC family protein n=1 Tax=Winogradskyella sp. MH6 TaxID=2929510 RepID=UPI001FB3DEA8|nr:McrC family protein [Winogradskyella sp. MH6]
MDVFCEIPCLTEFSKQFNGIVLQKKWFKSADKRVIGQYLQKFINYNSKQFDFLDVQPFIVGTDQNVSIAFRTSGFIGSIPLRAPDTGKQIGDFVVTPRFSGYSRYEDYIEILNLLDTEITPHILDSLPLVSGKNYRPPLYLEAVKYINSLESLINLNWRKFDNIEKISEEPIGKINWQKYSKLEYKVENRLKFPVRKNVLSEFHSEYSEIRFVFDLCKKEILSANTPLRIKTTFRSRLNFIEEKLYYHKPKYTTNLAIKFSDNPTVTKCKQQANKILNFNLQDSTAWKIDFSDVFEKFVQYLFRLVAKEIGGRIYTNYKFHAVSKKFYSWELKHIEPDAIYQKKDLQVFIDAKYKSNLYNKYGISENLKEDHRHDLHQIMAYSSFSKTGPKNGLLCYPSETLESKTIKYKNQINEVTNSIIIIGIPLKKESINSTKTLLMKEINKIEKLHLNQF